MTLVDKEAADTIVVVADKILFQALLVLPVHNNLEAFAAAPSLVIP
ncbi:hypothetical protein [Neobacillus niacini]